MSENCNQKVKAICLLKIKQGSMSNCIKALEAVPEIVKLTSVTGDVDVIAHIEVDNPDQFHVIFADFIDKIPGVDDTKTYVVMREFHMR
jgi:DNA-binding Lrp family transcriptional regulator